MSNNLVVMITGINRGIGHALATAYLLQPNCTVIGSIRDDTTPEAAKLLAIPKGDGSRLLLVKIESSSPTDASSAVRKIEAAGINHIDILIANAGVSPPLQPIETVSLDDMASTFNVNTLGPLALYQVCHSMLQNSKNPKFVPITSAAGSIGGMERGGTFVAPAAAHCSSKWLVAVAISPGLVATDMGNKTAQYLGLERAPWTAEESAEKIMGLIEKATRDTYSGKFMDAIKGTEKPW
ncbi:NAD(P)-binding Rossmann-fold containing protein [Glarea lozoyensis ATCC 20868]|uniref:NAD(P)-binding Rossmann-fold containing protein n=1 Tax=Glarea lozoyensis (strain ATCC 20868 / MF5171) TaxID=1116229 RepID=S3DD86_GLAL2|nr:NAD(P)-binding Rossmann-fold containing protein [Glarea lozoyensis ATCC 20868]EPE35690.1 NAD(P)-binding Rossmann-fold containing protein [Glarea lozoyensis ATCC 20868]